MRVTPLSDALGVEVHGVELSQPIDHDTAVTLRRLFDEHHLLLFRAQEISGDDQVALCRCLRPVIDPVAWISNVEAGFHPEGELLFHSDYAFTPHPMLGLSLYAVEISAGAAPTNYASNVRALRQLPASLRARLDGLRVVHMIDSVNGRENVRTRLCDVGSDAPEHLYPRVARPVVWQHPVTGVDVLFVMQQQASHIEGWGTEENEALFAELFAHLYRPDNVYTHEWEPGDLVVWDNIALQHGRRANPNAVRRSLRRVTMGEVTTADLIRGSGFDPEVRATLRG